MIEGCVHVCLYRTILANVCAYLEPIEVVFSICCISISFEQVHPYMCVCVVLVTCALLVVVCIIEYHFLCLAAVNTNKPM